MCIGVVGQDMKDLQLSSSIRTPDYRLDHTLKTSERGRRAEVTNTNMSTNQTLTRVQEPNIWMVLALFGVRYLVVLSLLATMGQALSTMDHL